MSISLTPHDYIRLCYRGIAAYADGLPIDLLRTVHIFTELDQEIARAVKRGSSVVLTGNPGDGKTHLLRVLEEGILKAQPSALVEYDASEVDNSTIISKWKAADRKHAPFCIAINEAVLKQLADENPTFDPVTNAQAQVEGALSYYRDGESPPNSVDAGLQVFDLSRRNVLSTQIMRAVVDTFTKADHPGPCNNATNDFSVHAKLIGNTLFLERLQLLLERAARRGFHCTLRELQGLISYLLCRGLDCDALAADSGNADRFITELVFTGEGALFDEIRRGFDPRTVCHPIWDVCLIGGQLDADNWRGGDTEILNACDVEDIREVERRRRRFYFFNDEGSSLLGISDDPDALFDEFLKKKERDVLRQLIPYINSAFRDSTSDDLRVWKCHRFDHSDERTLCSMSAVPRRNLEVLHPRLCMSMSRAYEYLPDHLVLQLKDEKGARLVIDFEMFEFLRNTEFGMSILSLTNHVTRRLWRFMERLAASENEQDGEVDVRLLDLESGKVLHVVVDLDESQYVSVEGAR
ncbi:MAG: hypothetical protein AB7O62_05540 [Pirellulales bacterium]